MKKQRKLFILILLLTFMFVLPFVKINKEVVNANSNLQVMKNSSGNDMTYRNSSEKVYGLAEYDYPTAEYRAVWVSTFVSDIPKYTTEAKFKSDVTALLDDLVSMGMNAMVFHVRTHNNALYNSDLNPIATWWADVNFDEFDPLTWLIDETHKRGIEFHAWMNPYRITDGYVAEPYPEGHPCLDPSQVLTSSSGAKILDPGSTRVQDFIVDTCMEFLDRYDADAIHFDDYFYISGVATNVSANQKRQNVDNFIKKLSDEMKKMNEEEGRAVQLGISPSGIYQNGKYTASPTYDENGNLKSPISSNTSGFAHYDDYLYSDTKKWIDNEWIDYITPQTYWGMEHNGANFYELSRWWSWCVRYKKVNLYLGMGIYMAAEDTSSGKQWQKNQNEVQNQLLNAGQYDEVKGICYYKYSYLSSNNSIIKRGVDLIKNDYYKKRIPGAVIQRYANSLPSVEVSNITLNGNVMSWDKIDNVFGYMVYQVPKGETLDINNIDHVYEYTQNTSVTGVDTIKYDYYLSSVNRANVKSNPVGFGTVTLSDAEQVVQMISNLPSTVTLEDANNVKAIRTKYNALSDSDKALVTNYAVLVKAEELITKLSLLKAKADSFINTIDTKLNKSRKLPVEDNMKWTYVNINDASKYNITTGTRLIDYIAPETLKLYLEVTDGDVTYKQIVEFDLCYLEEGYTGLYYRNDPSSMSEYHVGAHTGATSFIGWSNATVTVGNQVLFVAKDNYIELTSNKIPGCNWTSCAGVYTNKSSSNITMTLGDAFETASPTYGYFVIGTNKQIKFVSSESPATASVTLAPNETLFIIRYLDRLINNNPFTDFTKLAVGTTAFVSYHTEEDIPVVSDAEKVITLINTLPSNITLNDEELINNVLSEFNKLSETDKTLVTNKDVLTNAVNKITELKEFVENLKLQAMKDIDSYVNLDNYSAANQTIIKTYIESFKTNVVLLKDEASIQKELTSVYGKIDNVKTLQEELADYVNEASKKIESLVVIDNYSIEKQALINEYIASAKVELNSAKSNIEVDQIVDKVKAMINALPTLDEEFAEYRNKLNNDIAIYVMENSYSKENQALVDNIVYELSISLSNAKSYAEMDKLFEDAKLAIDNVPTKAEEAEAARIEAINQVNSYVNLEDYEGTLKENIIALISSTIEQINKETSVAKINNTVTTFTKSLSLLIIVDYAETVKATLKAEIKYELYSDASIAFINNIIDCITCNVSYQTTKEEVDALAADARKQISEVLTLEDELAALIEYALGKAQELTNSINFELYSSDKANEIRSLIETISSNITISDTTSSIDEKVQQVTLSISNVKTLAQEIADAKVEVEAYLNSLLENNYEAENKKVVEQFVNNKKGLLENLNSLIEISNFKETTITEYTALVAGFDKEPVDDSSNCGCAKSSAMIITLTTVLACALLILRKKH